LIEGLVFQGVEEYRPVLRSDIWRSANTPERTFFVQPVPGIR